MAEQSGQEKTEAPSDKRRDETREEGQVAYSREVPSAALLAGILLSFIMVGPQILETSKKFLKDYFINLNQPDMTINLLHNYFSSAAKTLLPVFLPFIGVIMITAIMASVFQVGFKLTPKALAPKFSKLSPLGGIKRLFSMQSFADLLKSLFKLAIIGYIAFTTYKDEIPTLTTLSLTSVHSIIQYNFSAISRVSGKIVIALVVLAVFDLFYQRWDLEQKLKMTKQEVKEEFKQSEGDPQLKSRIRQIQREMSRARMMQEVPKADAVIVNPTHYAVAIRYDRELMSAPQVTAKGVDFMALRMKTIAKENEVPILERPALARELYGSVEVGQTIPDEFFKLVAEILAYVYRLKKKKR
ncbi:flagellar biosynthesis protein FlhB [Deltaproteobacteria bacterium TL4]